MSPHILINIEPGMHVLKDELFGPVVGIKKATSDEDAISCMNHSSFGLTASIWTSDMEAAVKLGDE